MEERHRSEASPKEWNGLKEAQIVDPWFQKVYDDNYPIVYRYAKILIRCHHGILAADLHDLVQETFFILYRKRKKLYTHVNITGWLIITFRYHYANRRRKWIRHNRNRVYMQNLENAPDPKSVEESAFTIDPSMFALLKDIVGEEKFRAITDFHVHKIPIREIAKTYGKSETAMRVQLYRSRKAIRNYLNAHKEIILLIFIVCVTISNLTT